MDLLSRITLLNVKSLWLRSRALLFWKRRSWVGVRGISVMGVGFTVSYSDEMDFGV
jgi:hypothetical protein